MPDHALVPLTALGGTAPRRDTIGTLSVAENPDVALASLAARKGREAAFEQAAKGFLGAPLPGIGTCSGSAPIAAFWTGPDQWMLEAPHASHELLADMAGSAFGDAASVTEQTDGWVRFDIEGPRAATLFERLSAIDIHAMAGESVARTQIHHLGCFVLCRAAETWFSIYGPRSSAASLHHALVEAATSLAQIEHLSGAS